MDDRQRSNRDLLAALTSALKEECVLLATVLTLLIEVEERRLHFELACSSLFDFCRRRLGLSEGEAFRRITAARLAKRFPEVLDAIRDRRVHLSSIVALKDLFTAENVSALLGAVAGKTKREVEELVAELAPRPDARTMIRRLPDLTTTPKPHPTAGTSTSTPPGPHAPRRPTLDPRSPHEHAPELRAAPCEPRATRRNGLTPPPTPPLTPLGDSRHRVQLTIASHVRAKLERAQSLMRHRNVDGDLAVVFERALDLLIAKLEKEKLGATTRTTRPAAPGAVTRGAATQEARAPGAVAPDAVPPSTVMSHATTLGPSADGSSDAAGAHDRARSSRTRVTSAMRREVVRRDEERCTFVSPAGERCPAGDFLELDHRHPLALGGTTDAGNLRLLCRAHNQYAAEKMFGRAHVAREIHERRRSAGPARPFQPTLPIPTG